MVGERSAVPRCCWREMGGYCTPAAREPGFLLEVWGRLTAEHMSDTIGGP
jgi:hypothetical protein